MLQRLEIWEQRMRDCGQRSKDEGKKRTVLLMQLLLISKRRVILREGRGRSSKGAGTQEC